MDTCILVKASFQTIFLQSLNIWAFLSILPTLQSSIVNEHWKCKIVWDENFSLHSFLCYSSKMYFEKIRKKLNFLCDITFCLFQYLLLEALNSNLLKISLLLFKSLLYTSIVVFFSRCCKNMCVYNRCEKAFSKQ